MCKGHIDTQWARSSSAKRPAKRSAKKTKLLAELLSTDLSRRWDKTFVLAGSLYPQVTDQCRLKSSLYIEYRSECDY